MRWQHVITVVFSSQNRAADLFLWSKNFSARQLCHVSLSAKQKHNSTSIIAYLYIIIIRFIFTSRILVNWSFSFSYNDFLLLPVYGLIQRYGKRRETILWKRKTFISSELCHTSAIVQVHLEDLSHHPRSW